jgi:hypothetical protein
VCTHAGRFAPIALRSELTARDPALPVHLAGEVDQAGLLEAVDLVRGEVHTDLAPGEPPATHHVRPAFDIYVQMLWSSRAAETPSTSAVSPITPRACS